MEVTLANALRLKNRQVRKVQDLEHRMTRANVYYWDKVDDDGKPTVVDQPYTAEQFHALKEEWLKEGKRLCEIKKIIAAANQVPVDGKCIDGLVKERGEAGHVLEVFKQFRGQCDRDRYEDRDRIKKTVMTVPELDSEMDKIQDQIRGLDDRIAEINAAVKVQFPD
jgi:hypothetical protein